MIHSNDRGWWLGGSDASFVTGNWETDAFKKWWRSKVGLSIGDKFNNKYTLAGTYYEHAILDTIPGVIKDKQIKLPEYGLRVNYDGITERETIKIHEVKTHKADKEFKVSKIYWRQAQVEIFAAEIYYGKPVELDIVSYPLTEEHYKNYFLPIDRKMICRTPIEKSSIFIGDLIPKLLYLKHCMKIGSFPTEEDYEKFNITK